MVVLAIATVIVIAILARIVRGRRLGALPSDPGFPRDPVGDPYRSPRYRP